MDAYQVRRLVDEHLLGDRPVHAHERDGRLVINDLVALPIWRDCSWGEDADVEIYDDQGDFIGVVCSTSTMPADPLDRSDYSLAAYLTEQDFIDFSLARPLSNDYLVIKKELVEEYFSQYADSSAIWGGFAHQKEKNLLGKRSLGKPIKAIRGIVLPLEASRELCRRSVLAAHPFERFLKHYHQLELLSDWFVARQMAMLPDDLKGFDKIMSTYSSTDISRLTNLVAACCYDKAAIMVKMDALRPFASTGREIFQDFSKKGNPLGTEKEWESWMAHGSNEKNATELASYWMFRVRSSIAHHRVGEYMLGDDDQEFVVSFAEPLLLELVRQVLSSERLRGLL